VTTHGRNLSRSGSIQDLHQAALRRGFVSLHKSRAYFPNPDRHDKFQKFQLQKKSGTVDIVMIKFGLTILTMNIFEFLGWSWPKFARPF
jgi:hypothetical protein